ncbi:MAG: FtsQ-type POTRA domain-containing protein [Gemmiger sp.]
MDRRPQNQRRSGAAPFDYEQEVRRPVNSGRSNPARPGGMQMVSFDVPAGDSRAGQQQNRRTGTAQRTQNGARRPAGQGGRTVPPRTQPPPKRKTAKQPGRRTRTTPQQSRNVPPRNPQQAGYRQGSSRPPRRMTNSEKRRIRRRRAILGGLLVAAALIVGVILSVNLLFKVTGFRVENPDKSIPADTGIYTEQQIVDQLGVQVGDNLFGFSTADKSEALGTALPYLETAQVRISLPGTVVVKVKPAVECFKLQTSSGWVVLSDKLKVLDIRAEEPEGIILLEASVDPASRPTAGLQISLVAQQLLSPDEEDRSIQGATMESAQVAVNDTLTELVDKLREQGLLDGTTMMTVRDLSEISFLYEGRISVKLGTTNNLDYKLRLAASAILDTEKGLAAGDHGTLDVSFQREDGEIRGYFLPAEPTPAPTPEPTPEADAGQNTASDE